MGASAGPIGAIAGGVLGGIAGSQKDKTSQTTSQNSSVNLRSFDDLMKGAGAGEQLGSEIGVSQLRNFQSMVSQGAGEADVMASLRGQRNLADMLGLAGAQGGFAQGQDIQQAQQFASQVFAPQREMLSQNFEDQRIQTNRLAAQLGRPVNDPVLQARMAQSQNREMANLAAQQGAFGAQQAQDAVGRRLQLAGQAESIRSGLATQAFQNRTALAQLGRQLTEQERNFRLAAAGKSTTNIQEKISGGGVGGAIAGAIGGASTFAGAAGKFGGPSGGTSSGGGFGTSALNARGPSTGINFGSIA